MPSAVPFTRAQKWDLVRISAAAVASTVFFTTPIFLVRPQPAAVRHETRAPEPRDGRVISSPEPANPSNSPVESDATPSKPLDENVVSVVTSTEFASATIPSLQRSTSTRTQAGKPAQVRARANSPAPAPSLGRRLVRFLAGKGKYNVKPFPTVNTSGS